MNDDKESAEYIKNTFLRDESGNIDESKIRDLLPSLMEIIKLFEKLSTSLKNESSNENVQNKEKWYEKMKSLGWMYPVCMERSPNQYSYLMNLSDDNDDKLTKAFCTSMRQNWEQIIEQQFSKHINCHNIKNRNQETEKIIEILRNDFSNCAVLMPLFVGTLDRMLVELCHKFLPENDPCATITTTNQKSLTRFYEAIENSKYNLMDLYYTLLLLDNFWSFSNFENPSSIESITRHRIQHGYYFLDEIDEEDFLKLLNLIAYVDIWLSLDLDLDLSTQKQNNGNNNPNSPSKK